MPSSTALCTVMHTSLLKHLLHVCGCCSICGRALLHRRPRATRLRACRTARTCALSGITGVKSPVDKYRRRAGWGSRVECTSHIISEYKIAWLRWAIEYSLPVFSSSAHVQRCPSLPLDPPTLTSTTASMIPLTPNLGDQTFCSDEMQPTISILLPVPPPPPKLTISPPLPPPSHHEVYLFAQSTMP